MTLSAVPGSNQSAMRAPVVLSADPAPFLVGVDGLRTRAAGSTGGGVVVVLVVVGLLLLGLILISAGCGPPN